MCGPSVLPIEFVIVGGSVAGLSAAIALSRAGHKARVLEALPAGDHPDVDGGIRLSPNASRLLYRWGMEPSLRANSFRSLGMLFAHYETGDVISDYHWDEDILTETGGDFLLMHFSSLRRVLTECAVRHGVDVRYESVVTHVQADPERPWVGLQSGERLEADVVVCADGLWVPHRFSREKMLALEDALEEEQPLGMKAFDCLVPDSALEGVLSPENLALCRRKGQVVAWFSSTHATLWYPKRAPDGSLSYTFLVYVPTAEGETVTMETQKDPRIELLGALGKDAYSAISTVAAQATTILRLPMQEQPYLDDWLHPGGRVLSIGDACHPLTPGSIYNSALACGDGATLGRLFAHLQRRDQIDFLLHGVESVSRARAQRVRDAAPGNIFAVQLPPGATSGRERGEKDVEDLGNQKISETVAAMEEAVVGIFAWDPEEEAEEWWQEWGLMQERAANQSMLSAWSIGVEVEEDRERRSRPTTPAHGARREGLAV